MASSLDFVGRLYDC
uniref:Uncharacterized protein n=1 Tax=Arundo donax TaxID=35708 RepID=A0A0A9FVK0_ARUDO